VDLSENILNSYNKLSSAMKELNSIDSQIVFARLNNKIVELKHYTGRKAELERIVQENLDYLNNNLANHIDTKIRIYIELAKNMRNSGNNLNDNI